MAISTRPESGGDVLLVLPSGLCHASSCFIVRASGEDCRRYGGFLRHYKEDTVQEYRPNGYIFVPISVKTFGRLGTAAMELINKLAATAAAVGEAVEKDAFIAGAWRGWSVGLCRVGGVVYIRSLGVWARASGSASVAGMTVPTSDVP